MMSRGSKVSFDSGMIRGLEEYSSSRTHDFLWPHAPVRHVLMLNAHADKDFMKRTIFKPHGRLNCHDRACYI
jgi:hypothetical protein